MFQSRGSASLTTDGVQPCRQMRRPAPVIFSVQYFRAVAAVAVVISHQLGGLSAFGVGAHGVDLFFVISGFIIFSLTEEQAIGPRRFLLDRLARIAPLYWLATLLAFAAVSLKLPLYGCSSDPLLLLKSLLFIPAYSPNGHLWPTLLLGWTLNYEMVFYLLFAVFLYLPVRFRTSALALTLLPIVLLGRVLPHHGAIAATYTNPLQVEFLAGALLGSVFGMSLKNNRLPGQVLYSLAIAGAMLALALIFHDLVYAAVCVVIVSAGLIVERQGRLPRSRGLKVFGDASFAIYLCQQFAFDGVGAVFGFLEAHHAHLHDHALRRLLSIVVAVALGVLVYACLERPLLKVVRRRLGRAFHTPIRLNTAIAAN